MKIAMLQRDLKNGAYAENAAKLGAAIETARELKADLCVAPTEAIAGPARAEDYLKADEYARAWQTLENLARESANCPPLLCGLPDGSPTLLEAGLVVRVPPDFQFRDVQLGIIAAEGFLSKKFFPDIIVHAGARRYYPGSMAFEENDLKDIATARQTWVVAPNLTGGYGELVYPGYSLAVAPNGNITARGKLFEEDLTLVDTGHDGETPAPAITEIAAQWRALVVGTRDFVRKSGFSVVVIGLSGGMDSALVACLAAEALGPENVLGVLMPSPYSSPGSVDDSLALAAALGIKTETIPIDKLMKTFDECLDPAYGAYAAAPGELSAENLQARIRAVLLMALANKWRALVLNTSNRSESAMGYSTLYGDTAGALAVIGDIYKTRVYELARWLCEERGEVIIPRNIFDKAPSAELRPNQRDTDSLPPYEELDPKLKLVFSGATDEETCKLRRAVAANAFKRRQSPPRLLVGLP